MADKKYAAQERWQKENGYISKSFWMYRELAERFGAACKERGRGQSEVIRELMEGYVDGGGTQERDADASPP